MIYLLVLGVDRFKDNSLSVTLQDKPLLGAFTVSTAIMIININ